MLDHNAKLDLLILVEIINSLLGLFKYSPNIISESPTLYQAHKFHLNRHNQVFQKFYFLELYHLLLIPYSKPNCAVPRMILLFKLLIK